MGEIEKKKVGDVTKTIRYGQNPSTKIKKIVTTPTYLTNGEYLLVVKDVEHCTITLDGYTTESVKIKVLEWYASAWENYCDKRRRRNWRRDY